MTVGAVSDVARERDLVLRRFQVLAAEVRTHEQATRLNLVAFPRPADERLYRRLRQINGGTDDGGEVDVPGMASPPQLLPDG